MSKKLGNLIKEARAGKGMTQAALAGEIDGLTASDVSKIERGEKEPSQDIIKKIAKVLGVTQKSLLDAASETGKTSSGKTSASGNTSSGGRKTSGSGKTSTSNKKTSGSAKTSGSTADLKLTAAEKRLVQLYRKADKDTKKAAMDLLSGEGGASAILNTILSSLGDSSSLMKNDTLSNIIQMLGKTK